MQMNPLRTTGASARLLQRLLAPLRVERRQCSIRLRESGEGIDVFVYDSGAGSAEYRRTLRDVRASLSGYVYGFGETGLAESVGRLMIAKRRTLALAESLTGGLIADRFTDLPGSSTFFMLSLVTYSNESKMSLLGVPPELIERWGAVSRQTCLAMVRGLSRLGQFRERIAVTGIAGPSGGTPTKPVGTVYVALQDDRSTTVTKISFVGTRREIKEATVRAVMQLLWEKLVHTPGGGASSASAKGSRRGTGRHRISHVHRSAGGKR